ncbi:MAG: MgtC/SapB family protein [Bacteroidetes bacterium]|nr:MgtC/SapB family protein [Bacteroidota bacterium]MBU2585193.1 MgtC/SapB family protein [Bacteroidota bacterium]
MNKKSVLKNIIILSVFALIFIPQLSFGQSDIWGLLKKESILPEIAGSTSVWQTIISFFLAGLLGALVSFRRNIDAYGFAVMEAHIILSFAAALMMMIIGTDIARAFGLMGAATIVRYRYSLNNPREASSLVIALGLGMACGVGLYFLAIIGALFARFAFNLFDFLPDFIVNLFFNVRQIFILKVAIPSLASFVTIEEIDEMLSAQKFKYRLISSKEKKSAPEQTTLTYEIILEKIEEKDSITQLFKDKKIDLIDIMWIKQKADKVNENFSSRGFES